MMSITWTTLIILMLIIIAVVVTLSGLYSQLDILGLRYILGHFPGGG